MLFNSIDFAIFLPVVFLIYWFGTGKGYKAQNFFTLIASYVFYGWWDWRFLSLVFLSTVIDYTIGVLLGKYEDKKTRKILVTISVSSGLLMLAIFKYMNFFIDNFVTAFNLFGHNIQPYHVDIILPVGISFYTFQTISYGLDIYKRKLEPTKDFIAFATFVSFFPQLVAGPIERAANLLPQFYSRRKLEYGPAVDGLRQMLWGLFKKVVIADNCASYIDMVYGDINNFNGGTLLFTALLFPVQVYCDFSGYSDIAIGTARLFGVRLQRNFNFPFFSTSISEFWRRWHISLYTWFRDYVFLPIVFKSKTRNKWIVVKATFITFILIGFWHGAAWTFVAWGIVNAICIVIPIIFERKRNAEYVRDNVIFPDFISLIKILITCHIVGLGAVFFRAGSIQQAFDFFKGILFNSTFSWPQNIPDYLWFVLIIYQVIEWFGRSNQYAIQKTGLSWPRSLRWIFYIFIIFLTGMFMQSAENPFIYFNF